MEVLRYASRQQPPELVEVPARRDFLLSAVGGNGEDGGMGGDGQNGLRGDNGSPATRDDDATVRQRHELNFNHRKSLWYQLTPF